MNSFLLMQALGEIAPEKVQKALESMGRTPQSAGKARPVRKLARTVLLAAVITALLGATAYAVGISVDRLRQEKLRQDLKIEENAVENYEEYALPEQEETAAPAAPKITVLSTYRDGDNQYIYVNISPVRKEQIREQAYGNGGFGADLDGVGHYTEIYFTREFTEDEHEPVHVTIEGKDEVHMHLKDEAIYEHWLENYDEQEQSLTLRVSVYLNSAAPENRPDLTRPLPLHIAYKSREEDSDLAMDYGTVEVKPAEEYCREIVFDTPPVFPGPEEGTAWEIRKIKLYPSQVLIYIWHDGIEALNLSAEERQALSPEELDRYEQARNQWFNLYDPVIGNSYVTFSDGTRCGIYGALTIPYVDGCQEFNTNWHEKTVNIAEAVSWTVGGQTVSFSPTAK